MTVVPSLVVHGGAGRIDDQRHEVCAEGCRKAARAGLDVLARGGRALDAVQAAVRALEEDPEFNAGVGAALTRDGTVELDASIMDGAGLRFGAVGAVPELRRPIDLAREVMEDGEHVLLVGEAAWQFARERGHSRAAPGEMITAKATKNLAEERTRRTPTRPDRAETKPGTGAGTGSGSGSGTGQTGPGPGPGPGPDPEPEGGGTVGACAIDANGHVAAATSTGGITFKRRGRVGDTPLCGCGTYADDQAGAASATGHGESIIRVNMTRYVVDRLRGGATADVAAWAGVDELASRVRGTGGVIVVDRDGRIGLAHNTAAMSWARGTVGGEVTGGTKIPRP